MHTTSYNHIPYQSLPVPYTYLPHLAGLGRLFGLETVDPARCRVLEIGCAEASNLIPMAWYLPKSQFVGIDLSEVQIDKGRQLIESLGINNIKLDVQNATLLMDSPYFSQNKTKFDYILLHGVFSWVSPEDQQTLLAIAKSLLSEFGIIYISYNTYPGWHAQMVLRDAMTLYSAQYEKPEEKRQTIRDGIRYFKGFFKVANNEFSAYNTKRLSALEKNPSRYLYHEFLEEHNHPLYIKDFIKKADNKGLQYMSDALLAFDSPVLLGEKRNAFISDKSNRVERLQYMDFMLNQRFRRSLLAHNSQSIRNDFAPEQMAKLAFRGSFSAKHRVNLSSNKACKFYQDSDKAIYMTLTHPVSKAAAQILSARYPASIMYMSLLQESCQRVADGTPQTSTHPIKNIELFYHEFYLLLINDWVSLDTKASQAILIDWDKPIFISELSWHYARQTTFIPTFLLKAVDVDDLGMQILKCLHKGIRKQDLLDKIVALGGASKLSDASKKGKLLRMIMGKHQERQIKEKICHFLHILEKHSLLNNGVIRLCDR